MAGENDAYSQVFQGQGGTGGAFLTSDDGSSVQAYKHMMDQDLLKKKTAQTDASKFNDYIVTGYRKHVPFLIEQQQALYRDYANELKSSRNGQIAPTKLVELQARKAKLQALSKISDKMTDYVKEQRTKQLELGEKADGYDKVQEFVENTPPEKQLEMWMNGEVPEITRKPVLSNWFDDVKKDNLAYFSTTTEVKQPDGTYKTVTASDFQPEQAKAFSLQYAKSGIYGSNPGATQLLKETGADLEKDIRFKSFVPNSQEQQDYLIQKAADKFYNANKELANKKDKVTLEAGKTDKGAWQSSGSGSVTKGDFIFTKEDRSDFGGNFKEYHIARTDAKQNNIIPLRIDGAKDARTGEMVAYDPNGYDGPTVITTNALQPVSYIVGTNGVNWLKAKRMATTDMPEREILIPAKNVDKRVATEFGGADLQTIMSEIEKAGGSVAKTSLGESKHTFSKSGGPAKETPVAATTAKKDWSKYKRK